MESGVTKEQARSYLEKAGWDTETAERLVIADIEKAKSASVTASLPPHLRGRTMVPAKTLHTIAESMKPTSGGRRKNTINNIKRMRTIYARKLTRRRR